MPVTPDHIEHSTFSTVKRNGYNKDQVDRYLRTVAQEMRALRARLDAVENAAGAPTAAVGTDLESASREMAQMLANFHAELGERRRAAEHEVATMRAEGEREVAAIVSAATEEADSIRLRADRVLADAEHHAELVRSDGEQRVRERCAETLRAARGELQALARKKHEILGSLSVARRHIDEMESLLTTESLDPDQLTDDLITDTIIDLRDETAPPPPPPPPPVEHPAHPGRTVSFFMPSDGEA